MSVPLTLLGLGTGGLNTSRAREAISKEEAWILNNARAYQGKLETSPGVSNFIGDTLSGRILKIMGWQKEDESFRVNVFTHTKIYKIHPTTGVLTDISKAGGYNGSVDTPWHAIPYKDQMIAVNRTDPIQTWDGDAALASDLGGSPPKAGTIAACLTYVLLGDEVFPTVDPRKVSWNDSGDPVNWSTGDAGFIILYQGHGRIMNLVQLGEVVLAYRPNSIHMLFYVGPPFIFGQRQIISDHGLLAPRAVADLGNRHVYWGTDNVYFFDGSTRIPVADKVIDDMNASYDPTYVENILAIDDPLDREVYFAYPPIGSLGVNKEAWVFNYGNGSWRKEDFEATGVGRWRRLSGTTWDEASGSWDSQLLSWNQSTFSQGATLLMLGNSAGKIQFLDKTTVNVAGAARERIFETGIGSPAGVLFNRPGWFTTLEAIDVEFESLGSHNLEVWVGVTNQITGDSNITWTRYQIISNGTKRKINVRKTARYFAFRIRTSGVSESFRVSGIIPHFNLRGDR